MNKYIEPNVDLPAFTCPYCEAFSNVANQILYFNGYDFLSLNEVKELFIERSSNAADYNSRLTTCNSCNKTILWVNKKMIYPKHPNRYTPNIDLNYEIKIIYHEASAIFNDSPRAACALLRLCLEKMCIQLKCNSKTTLNENIRILAKQHNIDPIIIGVMEYVRITGNNTVHPNTIVNNDTKEIAETLFNLINVIADDLITKPKKYKEMFDTDIPESKRDEVNKKHQQDIF